MCFAGFCRGRTGTHTNQRYVYVYMYIYSIQYVYIYIYIYIYASIILMTLQGEQREADDVTTSMIETTHIQASWLSHTKVAQS